MAITIQKIFDKTRKLAKTSSAILTDAKLFDLTNETYLDIQRALANEGIEILGTIQKTDLVAGQENYQLPTDMLAILRLEINYEDATDDTKWKKMSQSDLGNLPYEWYELLKKQPISKPLYDLFNAQLFVFPKPTTNQTAGLRIWYIQRQPDFTNTSDSIPQILDNYWDVFCYGNAWRYLEEVGEPQADRYMQLYQAYLQKMIADLKTEVIEPIKITIPPYFCNGWL